MLNCENIYRVSILDVVFKLNKNYTPYIVLSAETLDENKMRIDACYYFTGRAKYFSYNELIDILNSFNIEVKDDKILDSLMKLKGKKVYLLKIPDYENKYQVLKDYNEVN